MQNNRPTDCHVSYVLLQLQVCMYVCILAFDSRHEAQKFHIWWYSVYPIYTPYITSVWIVLSETNCRLYLGDTRGRLSIVYHTEYRHEWPWDRCVVYWYAMCSINGSYIASLLLYAFCIQCYFILLPDNTMNHGQLSGKSIVLLVYVLSLIRRHSRRLINTRPSHRRLNANGHLNIEPEVDRCSDGLWLAAA